MFNPRPFVTFSAVLLAGWASHVSAGPAPAAADHLDQAYAKAYALYVDLHQHPELSGAETQTAAKVAGALRDLGYSVTEHVGGTGVVAILENGPGKTILLRTELDALPIEEKTGLPFASHVHAKDPAGRDVAVGHMCGHDLHMSALVATATIMARTRDTWHGTLMLIGQPAEETITGAESMLHDGLFTRFPRPDTVLALHVTSNLPAGQVGVVSGTYSSSADSLRITLFGRGGHGAMPQTTVDSVVLAARVTLALQTIVAREIQPGTFAVVTVGYLNAGTKNNVIPDSAELGLSVRAYQPDVRRHLLEAIGRIANAEAQAAGAPKAPLIEHYEATNAVNNDPTLAARAESVLKAALGADEVVKHEPITASDDFSAFTEQGVPGLYLTLGGADPEKLREARAAGSSLPSNHSPLFAPDVEPALRTAIRIEVALLRDLLGSAAPAPHR
ncbi:MAG TPA: amidohydrolase [Steroidobacteraceae bacterium]